MNLGNTGINQNLYSFLFVETFWHRLPKLLTRAFSKRFSVIVDPLSFNGVSIRSNHGQYKVEGRQAAEPLAL